MKRSKIFLGLTTCTLALVAIVAGAAKKATFGFNYQAYTAGCQQKVSEGTLVRISSLHPIVGYTNESGNLSSCTTKLYSE